MDRFDDLDDFFDPAVLDEIDREDDDLLAILPEVPAGDSCSFPEGAAPEGIQRGQQRGGGRG